MRDRGSRVYVLLAIMTVIMFSSMLVDMFADETSDSGTTVMNNTAVKSDEAQKLIEENETTTEESFVIMEEETETTTEEETETTTTLTSDQKKKIEKFYNNTVFVGDSIMTGFAYYSALDEAPEYVKNLKFLAASSYGINAALKGRQIMYEGQSKILLDGLKEINPSKIFINLGINELDGVAAENLGGKYEELIGKIKEICPKAKIYIIGVTYFVEGKETSTFNNKGIRAFNAYIKQNADDWGITYVDLPKKLSNEKGYLPTELSSDNRIHHTNDAYRIWVDFFNEFALKYSTKK